MTQAEEIQALRKILAAILEMRCVSPPKIREFIARQLRLIDRQKKRK